MSINEVLSHTGVDYDNAFIEYLDDRIGETAGQDQMAAWDSLPEVFKQYHALFALDSDVFNGGFEQYFRRYASCPAFIQAGIRGLDLVGSPAHRELAREAISIFVHYIPQLQELMLALAIPQSAKLTESDIDRRFQQAGDLQAMRFAWLEANRETIRRLG